MFKNLKIYLIPLIIVGVILSSNLSFSSQTRLFSMGDLTLVIEDEDNEINLYDFGNNPAWAVMDQKISWGRGSSFLNQESGSYRRILDPKTLFTLNPSFDAVKTFGPDKVFFGYVGYYYYDNQKIVGSVEKYPYEDKFGLLDSAGFVDVDKDGKVDEISSNFTYSGPDLFAGHSRRISKNTFIGGMVGYRLEHGVKRQYIWPETYLRTFHFNFGIAQRLYPGMVLGLSFRPYDTQERIDLDPGLTGGSVVKDVVGFQWRKPISTMTRTTRNKIYEGGLQGIWEIGRSLASGIIFNYVFKSLEIDDGLTDADRVVYWESDGYHFEYRGLWRMAPDIVNIGFSYYRNYQDTWTKNPISETILDEGPITEERYAFGGGVFPSPSFRCGAEVHFSQSKQEITDYIARGIRDNKLENLSFNLGAELRIEKNFWVRSGLIYAEYSIEGEKLPEDRLRDNNSFGIRLGLGYSTENALIDLALGYNNTKGEVFDSKHIIYPESSREKLNLFVSSKFFFGK